MDAGALSLALGAGLLAAVNPCGFALLPAYLGLLVATDGPSGPVAAVGRALRLTAAMTSGFAAVFLVFGVVVVPAAASVQAYLPWVTLTVGLLVAAGRALAAGRARPPHAAWRPRGAGPSRSLLGMAGFGASYALASVTCTIAPFLAVVVSSLRSGRPSRGWRCSWRTPSAWVWSSGVVAVAAALARRVGGARATTGGPLGADPGGRPPGRSGAYVAYYGWWELRVLDGGAVDDPVIGAAQGLRSYSVSAITSVGAPWLSVVLAALVLGALVARRHARRPRHRPNR